MINTEIKGLPSRETNAVKIVQKLYRGSSVDLADRNATKMGHRRRNVALLHDAEVVEVAPSKNSETPSRDPAKPEEKLS